MNYEAYFNNAKHQGVTFKQAYEMLAALESVLADDEWCFVIDCEEYKY